MGGKLADRFDGQIGDILESIFAHSRDCIKIINRRGELEYVSTSAKTGLGLCDTSEAVGRLWRDFWPEGQRGALDAALATAQSGQSARFEGTVRSADGAERYWEVVVSPVRSADSEITNVLAVSTDVTAQREAVDRCRQLLEKAESQASFAGDVTREMRHRMKNQLAVVNAVAKLLARHTDGARELARKLEGKLIAMGHAHDLLAIQREGPLTAAQAVVEVLAASGAGDRVTVAGLPEGRIPEESLQQIALLLGELQTNALKHGALRDDSGRVRLTGSDGEGLMTLRWEEDCGHPVAPVVEGHGGFQLIRRLGSAGGAKSSIEWLPTGLAVTFHIRTSG